MARLFVDTGIEINAPASAVWNTLTNRAATDQWAPEFSSGGPTLHIESDWNLGSPVLWKGDDGVVVVEGRVTTLEPNRVLRFTVADTRHEQLQFGDEDGITFDLTEHDGHTTLHVLQGDFAVLPEGKAYHGMTIRIWARVLPKMKELAEQAMPQPMRPTCGKGLAAFAPFPAKLGEFVSHVADNLEVHMRSLDLSDRNSRREYDAYRNLLREHREIAERLIATAAEMAGYRDLPMGKHDEKALHEPEVRRVFEQLVDCERELLPLLQGRIEQDQRMLVLQ